MKKIMFSFSADTKDIREEVFEFEDNVTDEEIEIEFQDWTHNFIDAAWWVILPVKGLSVSHDGYVGNCPKCNKFIIEVQSLNRCKHCSQPISWKEKSRE